MTLTELSEATQQHRSDYYTLMLSNHALIIKEVGITDKQTVSKALHMKPSVFSIAYQFIIAYDSLQSEV